MTRFISRQVFVYAAAVFCTLAHAEDVRLSEVKRLSNGEVQVTVTGNCSDPVTLQASPNMIHWQDLQSFNLQGQPVQYTDTQSPTLPRRTYRVRINVAPPALSDLALEENRVFPAPEGLNTIQYAPDGKLGFIFWRDTNLLLRERAANGTWSEQVVTSGGNTFKPYVVFDFTAPREDYRFQPSAALLYDSSSRPHVFKVADRSIQHFTRGNGWGLAETISAPLANADLAVLEAVLGPNDVIHFAALSAGSPRNLTYGTNLGGPWNWSNLSTVTDPPLTYWAPPFAARWLAMDVDPQNRAHIVFRSSLDLTYDSAGHPRVYSELKYASNASGSWNTQTVSKPRDLSGEAANGASIAIAPDGKPRILSWYDERGDGGSAEESHLYWQEQDGSGSWTRSVVVDHADGYIAGDGNKGSGFAPCLRYDRNGHPHILFSDHAGEHFGGVGQQEYAGNLRHAWWNGNSWSFETVFRQSSPLLQETVYPAFALTGNEMAITVLERDTQWNYGSFPPLSPSKYHFRFFTKALP